MGSLGASAEGVWNIEDFISVETLTIEDANGELVWWLSMILILWRLQSIMVYSVLTGCFVPGNPGCQKQVVSCYWTAKLQSITVAHSIPMVVQKEKFIWRWQKNRIDGE